MAHLEATTYKQLDDLLGHRWQRKIGNNTVASRHGDRFDVTLHDTRIVTLHKNGSVEFTLGGWATTTTRERINHFLRPLGLNVFQKAGNQYLYGYNGNQSIGSYDKCVINPETMEIVFD